MKGNNVVELKPSNVETMMIYQLIKERPMLRQRNWYVENIDYFNKKAADVLRDVCLQNLEKEELDIDGMQKRIIHAMLELMEVDLMEEDCVKVHYNATYISRMTNIPMDILKERFEELRAREIITEVLLKGWSTVLEQKKEMAM